MSLVIKKCKEIIDAHFRIDNFGKERDGYHRGEAQLNSR